MQSNRALQTLIVLLIIIASLYLAGLVWSFLGQFTSVLLLFFLAWLLAFVLRPIARRLTAQGLPYIASVIVVYLVLALIFGLGGYLLVPIVTQQVTSLINNYDTYWRDLSAFVESGQKTLVSWGVRSEDIGAFIEQLKGQAQSIGLGVLNNTLSVVQSLANFMLQLVLVLILSFYFMKDGDRIFGNILQLLPPRWQDEARLIAISIERSFGGFIRGQVLFALVYAVLTAVIMLGFGLDYVVIASIVAGLCMIIPLIGNFLAFVPPLLVCVVQKPEVWPWMLLVLFVMQSFQMNIVGPRVMSHAIGIHPLYVMGAMLVGGQVAGFWGALFGIPVAGAINLAGRPLMRRMRYQSPLYREVPGSLGTKHFTTGPLRAAMVDDTERLEAPPPEAVSRPTTAAIASLRAPTTAAASTPLPDWLEDDEELPARPPYTLSARLWGMALAFVARAYSWVGTRARARITRH